MTHGGGRHLTGTQAMPKGRQHRFGVNAFQSNGPPHLVQRWLGSASLRTTSIYGDVTWPEERTFATRMLRIKGQVRGRVAQVIPALKMRGKSRNSGLHGEPKSYRRRTAEKGGRF